MTNPRNFPIDYRHLRMDVTPRILVSLSYGDEAQEDVTQPTHASPSSLLANMPLRVLTLYKERSYFLG